MTHPLFGSFNEWGEYLRQTREPIWKPVLDYEIEQKSRTEQEIWDALARAYAVMKDAVETGLTRDMTSFSGLINNGAKKVRDCKISVLGEAVSYTHLTLPTKA
jgi:L-serine dehydratase